jgi:hypothetical protein
MLLLLLLLMMLTRISIVVYGKRHRAAAHPVSHERTASFLFTQPKVPWGEVVACTSQPFETTPSQSQYLHKPSGQGTQLSQPLLMWAGCAGNVAWYT